MKYLKCYLGSRNSGHDLACIISFDSLHTHFIDENIDI